MPAIALLRRFAPLLAFLLALALYVLTLAPGLYWGDSAQLQLATARPRLDVGVRDYPLWTAASSSLASATGLSPARAANLASALWGAVGVALCLAYARRVTGSGFAAAIAAAALAVSHLHWSSSSVAEVYSAATALLLLLLLVSRAATEGNRAAAFLLGVVNGIALLHHRMLQVASLAMLLVLVIGWARRGRLRPALAAAAAGGVLGTIPMAALVLSATSDLGLFERVTESLLGSFRPSLPDGLGGGTGLAGLLLYEARFLGLNLAGPQIGLLVAGALVAGRRPEVPRGQLALVCGAAVASPILFPNLGDRYVLLLPAFAVGCVLAGLGAELVKGRALRASLLVAVTVLPPAVFGFLSTSPLLTELGFFRGATEEHRRAFVWPGKRGNHDAEMLAREVLASLPEDAVLLSAWGEGEVIRFLREIEGAKPGVRMRIYRRPEHLQRLRRRRPKARVFVSNYPYLPPEVAVPEGYRLVERVPRALWELVPIESPGEDEKR
jgi:hypothetical protein